MDLLSGIPFPQQFQCGSRSASQHLRIDDSDLDIMFQADPVTSGSLPNCPDEAEGSRDKRGHMSLSPVHMLGNVIVRASGGDGLAGGKRGVFELFGSASEMLIELLADEVRLGRIVENLRAGLRSIDAEEEGVVLDKSVERKFGAEAILRERSPANRALWCRSWELGFTGSRDSHRRESELSTQDAEL